MDDRTLTDGDVEAIVDSLIDRLYNIVGKGFMKLVWTGVLAILLGLAVLGVKK